MVLEGRLAFEMLASQRLRATVLAGVFGIVGTLLGAVCAAQILVHGSSIVPRGVVATVLGTALYELAVRHYILQRLRARASVPRWVWYLNAFLETSMPTLAMLVSQSHFSHPLHVFVTPAVFAYYIFIMLSALSFDFRVSLFAGAVAAAEYLAFALYSLQLGGPRSPLAPIVDEPVIYVFKAALLLASGAGAAFVSAQYRARVAGAVSASRERNRAREADRLKSQFLANVSHEIRTPLNAILGYTQLLEADRGLPAARREQVKSIERSGAHLLALINDVLDLSKIEAGREEAQRDAFDMRALVQDLAAMFQMRCEDRRIGWRMAIDPLPPQVHGDARRLRQILTNLLGNSAKFTEAGHVALNVLARPDERYLFEVIDTGPGLAPEQRTRVFEPFEQEEPGREKGGTGLGLAIASRYVRLLGGTLAVDSAPGAETRFFFTLHLPVAEALVLSAQEERRARVTRLAPATPVRALVADDVAENRDVLAEMLRRVGVDVQTAASGDEALAIAGRHPPDIAFLDVRMPGPAGIELRERMAAGRKPPRLVAVSASVLSHERENCLRAGFDEFIAKPVPMHAVYDCLSRLLGARFDSEPAEAGAEELPAGGLREMALSGAMFDSLSQALQAHDMSQTRRLLDRLEAMGAQEKRLARHLRALGRRYDMKAMLAALNEVSHD